MVVTQRSHIILLLSIIGLLLTINTAFASDSKNELRLEELINYGLKNNYEISAAEARASAASFRIPQSQSLSDPMIMLGYQNEGFEKYTYGEEPGAQWMYSISQTIPFPTKLALKGKASKKEYEGSQIYVQSVRLKVIARLKESYYTLFLNYKNIDLIDELLGLFSKIEESAISRYSSGMISQQDVLMVQIEKYMLLEKKSMEENKITSNKSMINNLIGSTGKFQIGRPVETSPIIWNKTLDEVIAIAMINSPEVKIKQKDIEVLEYKVKIAEKEYYPDITLGANYYQRGGNLMDMWSLTTTINIPIYSGKKQKQSVLEAKAMLNEARQESLNTKSMITAAIKENVSMISTANKLIDLYKQGLLSKSRQDIESAILSYSSGKIDTILLITRLKSLINIEESYWQQLMEKQKAISRLEEVIGYEDIK